MIGMRAMSKKELTDRLIRKGESPENAEVCVRWLESLNLLDDAEYAAMLARHYSSKNYGVNRIKNELYRRGVPKELWDEAWSRYRTAGKNSYKRQAERRNRQGRAEEVTDFLLRRGYTWEEIKSALNSIILKPRNTNMSYKVAFISLGCAKNLVNSEQMLSLRKAGHRIISSRKSRCGDNNTCGFINAGKAIENILEMAQLKQSGSPGKSQWPAAWPRVQGRDSRGASEVDALVGWELREIVQVLEEAMAGGDPLRVRGQSAPVDELDRIVSTGRWNV